MGGYRWWQRYDGTLRIRRIPLDVDDDLNLKREGNNVFFIDLQHPIPVLPNILVQHTELSLTGLSAGLDVNGMVWNGSHLFDGRLRLACEHRSGLGAELGYRRFDLNYDDSDNSSSLVADGAYFSLSFRF